MFTLWSSSQYWHFFSNLRTLGIFCTRRRQSLWPSLHISPIDHTWTKTPLPSCTRAVRVHMCVQSYNGLLIGKHTGRQAKLKPDKFKQNTPPVSPLRSVFANRQCQASSFCHLNAPREGSWMNPRRSGVYDLWGILLGVYVLWEERAGSKSLITEREINWACVVCAK